MQNGVLIDPGFESTRQIVLVNSGKPSSKFFVRLLDCCRVFHAGVKELPKTTSLAMSLSSPCKIHLLPGTDVIVIVSSTSLCGKDP